MKRTPKTASVVISKHFDVKPLHYGYTTENKKEMLTIAFTKNKMLIAFISKWNGDILTVINKSFYSMLDPVNCREHIDATEYVTEDEENEGD